jgi:triosephosphate isomerase
VKEVDIVLCPPFTALGEVSKAILDSNLRLGAQNMCEQNFGAFTGEICVEQLKDLSVMFVLTGHSERRHVIKEPGELVAKKAAAVYAGGLTLIHCVGEQLQERDANQTLNVVRRQLDELSVSEINDPERLVIAYEPVWAIGTGRNATDAQAQEVHAFIRQTIGKKWNADFAQRVRIQYGGSMKPENAAGLLSQPDVDGGLIGGAALKAASFLAIVNTAKA